jgi:hypothetical protein
LQIPVNAHTFVKNRLVDVDSRSNPTSSDMPKCTYSVQQEVHHFISFIPMRTLVQDYTLTPQYLVRATTPLNRAIVMIIDMLLVLTLSLIPVRGAIRMGGMKRKMNWKRTSWMKRRLNA